MICFTALLNKWSRLNYLNLNNWNFTKSLRAWSKWWYEDWRLSKNIPKLISFTHSSNFTIYSDFISEIIKPNNISIHFSQYDILWLTDWLRIRFRLVWNCHRPKNVYKIDKYPCGYMNKLHGNRAIKNQLIYKKIQFWYVHSILVFWLKNVSSFAANSQ